MHLVTFRRGRGEPKPGAVWHDAVLDLGGLGKELAAQRGTLRRGRGAFPRSLLELIRGGEAGLALAQEAWQYGKEVVDHQAIEELARRKLAYPVSSPWKNGLLGLYGRPVANSKNRSPAFMSFRPGVARLQPAALSGSRSQAAVK